MRRVAAWLIVLGVLVAGGVSSFGQPQPGKDKKPGAKFTIGKETTFVLGPVDKDGFIDYIAAINEKLRQGVTPENNAAVVMWKALGPKPLNRRMPPEFYKWLGIPEPPEQGKYFVDLSHFLKPPESKKDREDREKVMSQSDVANSRPWKTNEFPAVDSWLEQNKEALNRIHKISKCEKYFSPLVPREGLSGLANAQLDGMHGCREMAEALITRAMLRLGHGNADAAWQDLLACHRLGRFVSCGGSMIECMVGMAIDSVASRADVTFLGHAKLDAKQLKRCLRDLQELPAFSPFADKVDHAARFMLLEAILMLPRSGVSAVEATVGVKKFKAKPPDPREVAFLRQVDWDPILRSANKWYDRIAGAMRIEDRPAREQALTKVHKDVLKFTKESRSQPTVLETIETTLGTPGSVQTAGKRIGDVLTSLLLPAFERAQDLAEQAEQTQRNLHVAFALAAYRSDHGAYPKQLDALAPAYLAKVPNDLFADKALIYQPAANGYLLYSVGPNGKDDQGHGPEDDPRGDDIAVRMPLPQVKK